jgi:anhydro-N-acetylmuramic acid kinase
MLAAKGKVDPSLIGDYLASSFFSTNQRRSLDRGDFLPPEQGRLSLEDGARTLSRLTGEAILKSASYLPSPPKTYVVCGGGRLNPVIMAEFADAAKEHGARVIAAEEAGFDGGAMEAEAWAYLAVRSMRGLPLTYPGTTGVKEPVTGGVFVKA